MNRREFIVAGLSASFIVLASLVQAASAGFVQNWRPKFYEGLEALADVKMIPKGYDGSTSCMELRHVSGALKFGAEADVKAGIPGRVKWTVRARVGCEGGAEIALAMEFFRKDGVSLGEKTRAPYTDKGDGGHIPVGHPLAGNVV